jgi:hypothetical protein
LAADSCVRSAQPVGYTAAVAAGNVCDAGPTAYQHAQLGDTVLLQGGTYTTAWDFTPAISKTGAAGSCNYGYAGTANLSGCVSFAPAPGQSVVSQVAGANTNAIRICADFISISGVTINQTTYTDSFGDALSNGSVSVGSGDNSCMPGGAPPHDVYLSNISYGGQATIVGGAYNVWLMGGTATSTSDLPWQFGGAGNNGGTSGVHDSGIVSVTFQGGNFANTDPLHHHMECVHMDYAGDHDTIAGDTLTNSPFTASPSKRKARRRTAATARRITCSRTTLSTAAPGRRRAPSTSTATTTVASSPAIPCAPTASSEPEASRSPTTARSSPPIPAP